MITHDSTCAVVFPQRLLRTAQHPGKLYRRIGGWEAYRQSNQRCAEYPDLLPHESHVVSECGACDVPFCEAHCRSWLSTWLALTNFEQTFYERSAAEEKGSSRSGECWFCEASPPPFGSLPERGDQNHVDNVVAQMRSTSTGFMHPVYSLYRERPSWFRLVARVSRQFKSSPGLSLDSRQQPSCVGCGKCRPVRAIYGWVS